MKRLAFIFSLVLFFFLGIWVANKFLMSGAPKETVSSNATVLLEKVEKVCKLVTVEGNFDERYDETNIKEFTVYLPLPSTWKFSKTARLRVKGKVLVGYDMDKVKITADSVRKTLILSNMPEPEIMAIDHTVGYENLDESWFNTFNEKDFTMLNQNAKEVLKKQAIQSRLLEEARTQGNQLIDVIRFMAESAGWKVEVVGEAVEYEPDELLN